MSSTIDVAAVAVALARAGFPHVGPRCLRMLVRWAQDRGIAWTVAQVDADPGLTIMQTADDADGMLRFAHSWLPTLQLRGDGAP